MINVWIENIFVPRFIDGNGSMKISLPSILKLNLFLTEKAFVEILSFDCHSGRLSASYLRGYEFSSLPQTFLKEKAFTQAGAAPIALWVSSVPSILQPQVQILTVCSELKKSFANFRGFIQLRQKVHTLAMYFCYLLVKFSLL